MDLRTVASPNRYHRRRDEESAGAGEERGGGSGEICSPSDAFDIPAKNVPVERLRRWRMRLRMVRTCGALRISQGNRQTTEERLHSVTKATKRRFRSSQHLLYLSVFFTTPLIFVWIPFLFPVLSELPPLHEFGQDQQRRTRETMQTSTQRSQETIQTSTQRSRPLAYERRKNVSGPIRRVIEETGLFIPRKERDRLIESSQVTGRVEKKLDGRKLYS